MRKFNVGDRVRVRSWEDMAKEFGVKKIPVPEGSHIPREPYIDTPVGFLDCMRHLCGKTGVVYKIGKLIYDMSDGSEAKAQQLGIIWDNPNTKSGYPLDNGMFELAE